MWEVASGRMKSKKEHMYVCPIFCLFIYSIGAHFKYPLPRGSSVVVCGWHPSGQMFASGDSKKKIVMWKR